MDPVSNPFQPGAGTPPPELAGRDELLARVRLALQRLKVGRHDKSVLIVGLRGVGKTVLLRKMQEDAVRLGLHAVRLEAPEGRSLPAMLAPELKRVLHELSRSERAKHLAKRGMQALAGLVAAAKATYQDVQVWLDPTDVVRGLADSGDFEHDLTQLLAAIGAAAKEDGSAIVLIIDELQYVEEEQLAALITALHRTAQDGLPVILLGAGLPQLRGQMGRAKSYAERMFDFPEIGALPRGAASEALAKPVEALGVRLEPAAIERLLDVTQGYPYFLQEWGQQTWNAAPQSPIRVEDVERASTLALHQLDQSFFRVRLDRLTPAERRYLRAMAQLGPGPHRSGDIAAILKRTVQSLGPTRSSLIRKGMVWSPNHGDTAFTVPLFDDFMKRIEPGDTWREA